MLLCYVRYFMYKYGILSELNSYIIGCRVQFGMFPGVIGESSNISISWTYAYLAGHGTGVLFGSVGREP